MSESPAAGRPRRVLIVVQNLPVPFDRRVWLEATTLARAGYRVSVICPRMKGFTAGRETLEDVDIHRYPLPISAEGTLGFAAEFAWCFVMTALLSVRVALFGRGFDVLHACNPPETYWLLGAFWRLFGKVFLFDHHDLSPEMYAAKFGREGGLLFRALLFLERMTFRVAQVVVTTNESHKAIAVSRGGKAPEDVHVVRSGPDLARFALHGRDAGWSRGKPFLVAYLGEICRQDGVDHLVRAMRILRDGLGRRDVHCVLVGGGPHQPAIARYAEEIGVADCCTFTGRVSDDTLCRILSSADIGVDPDPKTAWSDKSTMNKVVEYMFFGLPVLAYDLHETRVSAGEAGLYVTANDERALAEGIARLLDDAPARRRMGEIGRQRVRTALAWSYSVPPLLAAYDHAFALRAARRLPAPGPRGGGAAAA
ncbi:glycosyltransferase family 4 protein [Caldovatus aquaticus]|uniref:Glycosyltransferase family 4 protein n=1 Tax=Caldovatus aquaticus TaxID=2865671 RepID=A0ABS7F6P8_9PROT|nr:glycosyltransferase family 4 protein [Caldovatus aquaticus]MBW8271287.1 glycosyltransferase family 4 protein [Caldovatus aquaticus]